MKTDICKNKHKGNAESNAAFATIESKITQGQDDVLFALQCLYRKSYCTQDGFTSKEIADWLEKPLHKISGRITELKAKGLIKQSGRRDGCAVYQVTQ